MTTQRTIKMTGLALSAVLILALQAIAGETRALTSRQERQNYSAGVDIARSLKQQAGEVNLDILLQGLKDELLGEKLLMNEDELRTALAERKAEPARNQEQTANRRDMNEMKSNAGVKDAMTANAEPAADPALAKKEEDRSLKNDGTGLNTAGASVVERSRARSEIKARAAELRKRTIERELQGAGQNLTPGAI